MLFFMYLSLYFISTINVHKTAVYEGSGNRGSSCDSADEVLIAVGTLSH